MPDQDDTPPASLRAVGPKPEGKADERSEDPTAALQDALTALDGKLQFPDGVDGIAGWMHDVAAAVESISTENVELTRTEIRNLIDELLELNAQVQNLVRLKQLLS